MDLIIFAVFIAGAIFFLTRYVSMKNALKKEISDTTCVSCGSRNITSLGPNVYRCEECGYEGGSGIAAIHQQARLERNLEMSLEERKERGVADLKEAQTLLLAVDGTINAALGASREDLLGVGGSDRKHKLLSSAMTEIMKAQQLIKDSALRLGDENMVAEDFDIDFTDASFALDIHFDNLFFDLKAHSKIKQAKKYAANMLHAVQTALKKIGENSSAKAPSP